MSVQNKIDEGELKPGAKVSIYKDIAGEAERLDIKENKAVMVLVELLLDENIIKQVSTCVFRSGIDKEAKCSCSIAVFILYVN